MPKFIVIILMSSLAAQSAVIWKIEGGCLPEKLPSGLEVSETGTYLVRDKRVAMPDVPVQPRHRLRLIVSARCLQGASLEALPQLSELYGYRWNPAMLPVKFPSIVFEFRTAEKKLRRHERYTTRSQAIFSGEFQNYILESYVPENSAAIRIFACGNHQDNVLEIRSLRLEDVPKAEWHTLNINPDLSLGPYNTSGYGYMHHGYFYYDKDNRPFIDLGPSWGIGDYMPVVGGGRLSVEFGGYRDVNRRYFRITANYYRDNSFSDKSKVGTSRLPMHVGRKQSRETVILQVPEEARWMRLSFTWGALHFVRVKEIRE